MSLWSIIKAENNKPHLLSVISKTVFLFFLVSLLLYGCMEKQNYPDVPSLEYSGFTKIVHPEGYDTAGIISLQYSDGDGDLGLDNFDTTTYNFFVAYLRMDNGVLDYVRRYNNYTGQWDTINFNSRFDRLAPDDYSGWIKGTIEDTIQPLFDPRSEKSSDTVLFRIHIIDQAGNSSDTVETPLIIVNNPQ